MVWFVLVWQNPEGFIYLFFDLIGCDLRFVSCFLLLAFAHFGLLCLLCLFVCLLALFVCFVCLFVCLLACLFACLLACLIDCLLVCVFLLYREQGSCYECEVAKKEHTLEKPQRARYKTSVRLIR